MSEVHLPHPLRPLSFPLSPQQPSSQSRPNPSTRQKKAGTKARVSTAGSQRKEGTQRSEAFQEEVLGMASGLVPGVTQQSQALQE